ncbi:segregation and condensation protein B [Clostridium putrefaciens]|uniref:Segregation and condensation protein B n=1 Tax=Clostridium putrefaciens TaxID=99675 RepID=A0A381J9S5_9CLOT|nr:SMC-Scp complex subunit ScpB [Clostridium putrefaciens]SUY47167.1 segregation and condensation protein B [Clostridium putrefaciens]
MHNKDLNQIEFEQTSKNILYTSVIESLLFVSGEPIDLRYISNIIECSNEYTKELLDFMIKDYEEDKRGIRLIHIDGRYQLVTKPENSEYIQKILKGSSRQSLSQAALESLAIIAYKQPITRINVDEIRGVKSDSAIQKLLERNLIKENGRLNVPGRPILYGTTVEFLKQFNIETLKELPSLESFLDEVAITEEI